MTALYVAAWRSGQLAGKTARAREAMLQCNLCGCSCGVNRLAGETGLCNTGVTASVSSYGPRIGETLGWGGIGSIFFSHCNLKCVFCQNHEVSQLGKGAVTSSEEIAGMMLALQLGDCHLINLVSPSHVVPQIIEALEIAASRGLTIPLVYNSGGYDSIEALRLLEGLVDIYMPDMKYSDEFTARRFSGINNYPAVNMAAVKEMHRQTGDLVLDEAGLARRGLVVRHLVLPNGLGGIRRTARFLAQEVSAATYLNITRDYMPVYRAIEFPELSRPVTDEEFQAALAECREAGLTRLDDSHAAFLMKE